MRLIIQEIIHIVIFCYFFALKHRLWDLSFVISKNCLIRAVPTGTHKNLDNPRTELLYNSVVLGSWMV